MATFTQNILSIFFIFLPTLFQCLFSVGRTRSFNFVKDFLNKLQIIKTVFPEYADNIVYGAIAYLRSESDAHLRAIRKGLFVIRATGKSASIINSEDFRPTHF